MQSNGFHPIPLFRDRVNYLCELQRDESFVERGIELSAMPSADKNSIGNSSEYC